MSLTWLDRIAKAIDKKIIKPISGKLRRQNVRDAARARLDENRGEREDQPEKE